MMPRLNRTGVALLWLAMLVATSARAWAQVDDTVACDRAARDAEGEFGLPAGILAAIGSVESGRWPWTANIDGVAETYRSKTEAIAALTRVRAPRPADVDVGCFQISLRYHPNAFATMADALDPAGNARYAARFLRDLRDKYGDWNQAVGAYHSATVPLETDYRERVMAEWKGTPEIIQPKVVSSDDKPRWRVISIATALQFPAPVHGLPRVITLGN
jgi:hypothetical protein